MREAEWWERFSDIATKQWELTPRLNRIVREEYLADMAIRLHRFGGRLLEIGCGSGWVGMRAAGHDMTLLGVDPSPAQIAKARNAAREASLADAEFVIGGVADLNPQVQYDAIVIHAVLHHLTEDEISRLLVAVRGLMTDDGRLYIYEPFLNPQPNTLLRVAASVVSLAVWSPWAFLHWLGTTLKMGPAAFKAAVRDGWTGFSPDERPLDRKWLCQALERYFIVGELHYWHAYSLAFAMGCSELPPILADAAVQATRLLYRLDQWLLRGRLRDYVRGVWTFASMEARPRLESG